MLEIEGEVKSPFCVIVFFQHDVISCLVKALSNI